MSFYERPIQSMAVKNAREAGLNAGRDAFSLLLVVASVVTLPLLAIYAARSYQHHARALAEKLLPRVHGPEAPGLPSK